MANLEINLSGDGVLVDNLLDAVYFAGKTISELGVPESVIQKGQPISKTYIDGTLFDEQEYGVLYFNTDPYSADSPVGRVWLHVQHSGYLEARELLIKKYGTPEEDHSNLTEFNPIMPYQTADTALEWCSFIVDGLQIRLIETKEKRYSEIEVKKLD